MKTRIFLIICLITGIAVHLSANEKIYKSGKTRRAA